MVDRPLLSFAFEFLKAAKITIDHSHSDALTLYSLIVQASQSGSL